jgi:hypothetical protein
MRAHGPVQVMGGHPEFEWQFCNLCCYIIEKVKKPYYTSTPHVEGTSSSRDIEDEIDSMILQLSISTGVTPVLVIFLGLKPLTEMIVSWDPFEPPTRWATAGQPYVKFNQERSQVTYWIQSRRCWLLGAGSWELPLAPMLS